MENYNRPIGYEDLPGEQVNHPHHYSGEIECIDAIAAATAYDAGEIAFCKGNAIKYIWRAGKKENAVQDLEKAKWYIDRIIKSLTK